MTVTLCYFTEIGSFGVNCVKVFANRKYKTYGDILKD